MALDLNKNARTEAQPCVPCCVGNLERCCTSELTAASTDSIHIHFYNFRLLPAPENNPGYTMIGNPFLDFSIEPFSATLPRIDLVSSSAPPGFNYGSFGNNMTDLASAGLDPTVNDSFNYPLYNVTARAVPMTVNINAKNPPEVVAGTYREKYEVIKVNNTQYYADIAVQCGSNDYTVNLNWWRAAGENDIPYYPYFIDRIERPGMTRMIQMLNGLPGQESSGKVSKCDPLLVSGTSGTVCFPCGSFVAPTGNTFTGLANWRLRYSNDSGATFSTGIYNYSYQLFNYTMDWIITE